MFENVREILTGSQEEELKENISLLVVDGE